MPAQQTVLLLGGTGRTGQQVLAHLLHCGIKVRAIVRSVQKLPAGVLENTNLTVVETDFLAMNSSELHQHLCGCDAVISCLGHVLSLKGIFGAPRDLVTRGTRVLCHGIEALQPAKPVKFILMSSVSVNHPGGLDPRRGVLAKALLWVIRGVIPPARDNQQAANFLFDHIGLTSPFVQWTTVRPDTLLGGDVSDYTVHDGLVNSLFAPGSSTMANIAHFMSELVTNPKAWNDWKGQLPVVIDATTTSF